MIRTLLVLAAAWLAAAALAQAPAPAASAASAPAAAPSMAVVGEWQGPFRETKILKLLDTEDGVACYLYVPASVPSNTVCTGKDACAIHYPSGVGNLSCVKVREGRTAAKAPANAASAAAPRR